MRLYDKMWSVRCTNENQIAVGLVLVFYRLYNKKSYFACVQTSPISFVAIIGMSSKWSYKNQISKFLSRENKFSSS